MRVGIVCQSRTHALVLGQALDAAPEEITYIVESATLERSLRRMGVGTVRGSFRDREIYRQVLPANLLIVSLRDPRRLRTVLEAIRRERGETPVIVLSTSPLGDLRVGPAQYPWAHFVPVGERFRPQLRTDTRLARAKIRVRQLREVIGDARSVLVLLQDDPDPDSLACALALRALLGRNRLTMPMGSFGAVTRPENIAMMKVLDLEVQRIDEASLDRFDRIVMVDTQPPHLRVRLPRVDAVIDHHPSQTSYEARYKDVRNAYGATATILTEYLRAENVKVNERLATALLYAVRSDTLLLDRPVIEADVEAFTWLFPRANINWIRRIERPALPAEVLTSFAEGLRNARIEDKVIFSHLGPVSREDIIPQLADFCLQVEGVEWSAVSGVIEGELIISIRNVGYVQRAGAAVKAAFGDLGPAGGHRSMAKALLPLENIPHKKNGLPSARSYRFIEERFLETLRRDDRA